VFPFNKIILVALAVLALGVGAAVAASRGGGSDDPVGATIPMAAPTATVDVKGPCDEAEHVGDPRCAGAQVPEDNDVNAEANDANDDNGQADDDGANHDLNDDNGQAEDDNSGPSASSALATAAATTTRAPARVKTAATPAPAVAAPTTSPSSFPQKPSRPRTGPRRV
jgi:hypothetical protein